MALTWTDPTLTPDITRIKKKHIQEIRDYLNSHINATSGHPVATQSTNGLMSSADKATLDNLQAIQTAGHSYVDSVAATSPIQVSSSTGNINISALTATSSRDGVMTAADKAKLDGIQAGAQVNPAPYVLPSTLPATMISTDATHNFVTTTEKANWNSKQNALSVATSTTDGILSAADKRKLDSLDARFKGEVIMFSPADYGISDITQLFHASDGTPVNIANNGNPFYPNWKLKTAMSERFPIGASANYPANSTGGQNSFKIKSQELPVHHHVFGGDDYLSTWFTETGEEFSYDALSKFSGGGKRLLTEETEARGEMHNNMPQYYGVYFIVKYQ